MGAQPAIAGWHTEVGRRTSNQDAVLAGVLPDGRELIAVADGMGGHKAGEVASQSALETMLGALKAGRSLHDAVADANTALYAAARRNPNWSGMGTTLVVLLREGDHYQIANVGDSRAYRITDNKVEQITADHSFVAEATNSGSLSLEEARRSRWRNALTRAVGTDRTLDVDVFGPFDAAERHTVVLCSDGFYNSMSEHAMLGALAGSPEPQTAALRLTEEAYRNGSSDNITVAVIGFGIPGPPTEKPVIVSDQNAGDSGAVPLLWPTWRQENARRSRKAHNRSRWKDRLPHIEFAVFVVVLVIVVVALLMRMK